MNSIDQKYIVIPWMVAGFFLFLFYLTVYFPSHDALQRASGYVHRKQYDLAMLESGKIIAEYPNFLLGYFIRARAYAAENDLDGAIADYNRILRIRSYVSDEVKLRVTDAYFLRGNLYLRKGDYDHAIFDYSQLLQANFYYKSPYLKRSMAYFAKKDYINSLADMRRAQSLGVNIPAAFVRGLENAIKPK